MIRRVPETRSRRKQPATRVPVTIRIPEEIIQEIDLALERRPVPLSRNNWLLEAALEKLKKAQAGGGNGTE